MFRLCSFAKGTQTTGKEDILSGYKKSCSLSELRGKNQGSGWGKFTHNQYFIFDFWCYERGGKERARQCNCSVMDFLWTNVETHWLVIRFLDVRISVGLYCPFPANSTAIYSIHHNSRSLCFPFQNRVSVTFYFSFLLYYAVTKDIYSRQQKKKLSSKTTT